MSAQTDDRLTHAPYCPDCDRCSQSAFEEAQASDDRPMPYGTPGAIPIACDDHEDVDALRALTEARRRAR